MILLQGRTDLRTLADKVRDLWMDRGDIVIKCNIEDDWVSPDMIDVTIKQPKPSKWHRVEDGVPNDERQVLLMLREGWMRDGKYISRLRQFGMYKHDAIIIDGVTHWRELPQPPKKGKSK